MSKKSRLTVIAVAVIILAAVITVFTVNKALNNRTQNTPNYGDTSYTQDPSTVTVTFPEGYTVTQIAQRLEESGVCSAEDFLNVVNNPSAEVLSTLGIENPDERIFTLEGYVFPDTYEFYKQENAESVLGRFTDNFVSKITDADKARANELGYTMDEILTIASIIQKEAGIDSQNDKVSSVLHNRLKTGTPIQCDVTVEYLNDYCSPYLENGLSEEEKGNYNTYKCPALPKGPICNPGYAAIQSALYPEQTDYFYFVTDSDMNYYYASTWSEHVANCKKAGIPGY